MQALVLRRWEDGSVDVWIPRNRYRSLTDAEKVLNDRWNTVVAMSTIKLISMSGEPTVEFYKKSPVSVLTYYKTPEGQAS